MSLIKVWHEELQDIRPSFNQLGYHWGKPPDTYWYGVDHHGTYDCVRVYVCRIYCYIVRPRPSFVARTVYVMFWCNDSGWCYCHHLNIVIQWTPWSSPWVWHSPIILYIYLRFEFDVSKWDSEAFNTSQQLCFRTFCITACTDVSHTRSNAVLCKVCKVQPVPWDATVALQIVNFWKLDFWMCDGRLMMWLCARLPRHQWTRKHGKLIA